MILLVNYHTRMLIQEPDFNVTHMLDRNVCRTCNSSNKRQCIILTFKFSKPEKFSYVFCSFKD